MYLFKLNANLFRIPKKSTHCILRSISTSIINFESNLSLLRKRTGLTFTLCKKALEANNNDIKLAEEWLREEVKRSGLEKSQKMTFRVAKEGLVGVYIDKLKKSGILLEVNCETDFVAKNIKFKEMVCKLTKDFANLPQIEESPIRNSIQKYVINQDRMPKDNEQISEAITHLGEKIEIKKACFIKNHYDDPLISLVGYAHSTEGLDNHLNDVTFGKYGTIVALKQLPESIDQNDEIIDREDKEIQDEVNSEDVIYSDEEIELLDFDTAAKQICQHIIVASPDQVNPDIPVIDDTNETEADTKSSKSILVEQEFLHSDYETVQDFLKAHRLEVIDFVRTKCGQD